MFYEIKKYAIINVTEVIFMDPSKVGKFIKELRIKNNLTQAEFADKYHVTYQAVSKWENGKNVPDISLLKQISKDYNVSIDELLSGEIKTKGKFNMYYIALIIIILVVTFIAFFKTKHNENFEFKTLSTSCSEFKVTGSIAYNKEKSAIYISKINYCGGNDKTVYKTIDCKLYESNKNTQTVISSCTKSSNITLEEYLKDIELNVSTYAQNCKNYTDESLYLEINATTKENQTISYKVPLSLNNNCPK